MSDFTKQELEYIYYCFDLVTHHNDDHDEYEILEDKIQSMIANYCSRASKCPKCGEKRVADGMCWVIGCDYYKDKSKMIIRENQKWNFMDFIAKIIKYVKRRYNCECPFTCYCKQIEENPNFLKFNIVDKATCKHLFIEMPFGYKTCQFCGFTYNHIENDNKCGHKEIVKGPYSRSNPPKKCDTCGVLYR